MPMHTPDGLAADLAALGVRPGALVMVHASLRALGPVRGGAVGVLDGIRQTLGPDGTLLMVLGTDHPFDPINEKPEHERPALLAPLPALDPWTAPAVGEIGTLAEVFRTQPGVQVNWHPEGRFAAQGPLADTLLRDLPWDDYFGPDSALDRLCRYGGKVLRLGAPLANTTLIHLSEYWARVEPKRRVRRHFKLHSPDGPVVRAVDCLDDATGIVDWPGEDYFALIARAHLATPFAATGPVGNTQAHLHPAPHLARFAADWMEEHLAPLAGK